MDTYRRLCKGVVTDQTSCCTYMQLNIHANIHKGTTAAVVRDTAKPALQ